MVPITLRISETGCGGGKISDARSAMVFDLGGTLVSFQAFSGDTVIA
jgi:hypothetical protein